ncbi:exopolysaccharide biosynthesis polyprenyl glycosylphosphotransferase [Aerosakkonemataceae cyanobacterium BLCC-F50]|uniref:Anti-sigma factor antagonist n=1 Tax=Floridaenema flaviceps BLCC-F50 TaxID=3153642 RepID=A0ABV4XP68_9CYAN
MYSEVIVLQETTLIQVPQRLTVLEAVEFRKTCQELCQADTVPDKIIFDFSDTTFMDSSGLGALVSNFKLTKDKGIELLLRDVRPQVMAVLSLTGLNEVLPIEQTVSTEAEKTTEQSEIVPPPTHPSIYSWIKRSLDLVGSIVGLIITGILFIPIAIAIKLDSPGPIFFGQIRCGWMGKRFRIWKFRSMYIDAEARKAEVENQLGDNKLFKSAKDPRITKVGQFLRRTSLDELPQFWNVLKGEMSLVGTRPPTPDEVEQYEVPEWQRLDVKPGMTGEWQVSGRSQIRNFEDVIRLDLKYQENWSLMYDLQLIFKTIFVVFNKNSGAY